MDRYLTPCHLRNMVECLEDMKANPPQDKWELTTRLTHEKVFLMFRLMQQESGHCLHSFSASLNGFGMPSPLARVLMSWIAYVLHLPVNDPHVQWMHTDGGRFYIRFVVDKEEHTRFLSHRLPREALADDAIERKMLDIFKDAKALEMSYTHFQKDAEAILDGDSSAIAKYSGVLPDDIESRMKPKP